MIKKVFFEGSETKETVLEQKYMGLKKKTKICFFSKGLVNGFCEKTEIF